MATKRKQSAKPKDESKSVRASVSFPRELYETLERMAKEKKVSVAWIVRDAAEKYIGISGLCSPKRKEGITHDGRYIRRV